MKRWFVVLLISVLLVGCGSTQDEMGRAMAIRERFLQAEGCTFDAVVTADYGDKIYTFTLNCKADADGNLSFTVAQPETIAGIAGMISADGGKLTFDNKVLAFPMLAEGQITPVSAPWVLLKTLRSGYLSACGADGDGLRMAIDDSYQENALHLDIWTDNKDLPLRGEILWQGRRIVSVDVRNFAFL